MQIKIRDKWLKKKLLILFMLPALLFGQYNTSKVYNDFFKYATFYISTNVQNPITPRESFSIPDTTGTLFDITEKRKFDYNFTFGIRRIARYEYDYKDDEFYDGSEASISTASNVGAINGLEYNIKYNFVRDEGDIYSDNEIWIRFSRPYFMIKASYQDNQMIDLKYTDITLRGRYNIGKFNFTAGASYRNHPVYGYDPIADWVANNSWWGPLAYQYGYTDQYYEVPSSCGGGINQHWRWFDPDGSKVADTDDEFYKYYYGDIVAQYNEDVLDSLGMQGEISAVAGLDFYTYEDNFWLHTWTNIYPFHKGISDKSFDYYNKHSNHHHQIWINKVIPRYIDFDIGLILGFKLKKNFGFFVEGQYTRFWHIPYYQFKTGINYMFK